MEPEEEEHLPEDKDQVEIYSKRAILGFSIFFSTLFGAVLLMLNLRRAGYKKEGNAVMAFAFAYMVGVIAFVGTLQSPNSSVGIFFNLAGGLILTEYFFRKYFPEGDYYPRSIARVLLVSILISLVVVLLTLYYANPAAIGLK